MNPIRRIYENAPAFIPVPASLQHHRVEITIWPLDVEPADQTAPKRRSPPMALAGKARDLGDVINSVPLTDWGIGE